jgi:type I restriction enzyme S subunit
MSWSECKIEQLRADEKGSLVSGPFGSNISSKFFVEEGVPVIRGNNLTLGKKQFVDDGYVFVTPSKAHELRNCVAKAGDIIFTAAGTLGQIGLIPETAAFPIYIISNKQLRLRVDRSRCCPEFLYYYLSSPSMRAFIVSQNKGSSVPLLTLGIVRNLPIRLPDLTTQRKIAAILMSYDNLIEINERCIALLENVAQELYREWFVRMRFPGHRSTKFVKGVPEEWEIRELRECAEINPSSIGRNDCPDVIHYIDIRSVTTNHIGGIQTLPLSEAPGRARRRVKHGDIIWSSVRPANRAYCLIYEPIQDTIVSTGFAVIRPKQETPFSFLNFVVASNGFVDLMTAVAKGAAYPATSFDDFEKAKLLWPGADLLSAFHKICEPLFEQKHTLTQQNLTLAKTRELLLPRLISGKLSVDDLDIQFPPSMQEEAAEPEIAHA